MGRQPWNNTKLESKAPTLEQTPNRNPNQQGEAEEGVAKGCRMLNWRVAIAEDLKLERTWMECNTNANCDMMYMKISASLLLFGVAHDQFWGTRT